MTDKNYLRSLRIPSSQDPLRILMSACLAGTLCGYDGTANGRYPTALRIVGSPHAKIIRFCPEDFAFGTPREMCDIHGGTGLDVLEGRARVLTATGEDWTEGMIRASERMLALAEENQIELAVLMDISAACGSQVIYDGNRFDPDPVYQIGQGVCAAQLTRNGFRVISQRDFESLEILYAKLDPSHEIDREAIDHDEHPWVKAYFAEGKQN